MALEGQVTQPVRIVHYLNQYFAGLGGEAVAGRPLETRRGAVGPGQALQQILGREGLIEATIVCGDNFFNDRRDEAIERVRQVLRELKPDAVVAGPAFDAGRYGLACTEVSRVAEAESIPAVTGMHPENPGVLVNGREATIVPTGTSPADMPSALAAMARLAMKLARAEPLGPAETDGYLPRGIRRPGRRAAPGHARAVQMLVDKLAGRPYRSEVPYRAPEAVAPAPPVADVRRVAIALVTTGGLVAKGNPDGQVSASAERYFRYPIAHLQRLSGDEWEAHHAGYFTRMVNQNPDYVLPLGLLRALEAEGAIGSIHPSAYTLPGVSTAVASSRALGRGIAEDLRKAGAGGCILVST